MTLNSFGYESLISHEMLNFILGVGQFLAVWQLGFYLEKKLKLDLPLGYRAAIAFGLGEMVLSYSYFALGLMGGLRFWVLVPIAVFAFVFLLPLLVTECKKLASIISPVLISIPVTSLIIFALLLIYTAGACVPEREVDSLWYHLSVPQYYILHDGFIQLVPFNMPSHYPMNLHLHYTLSLLIGNDTTAKVFILCHFIPMLILLFSVVKRYASARWGLLAAAVYLCCLHFRLPVMVNNERAVYFHVFLSYSLLWWSLETKKWKCFWLAAVFCGMAMGIKFNGLMFGYAGQWMLIGGWMLFACHRERLQAFVMWCGHSLIAWLMMSPWLIKSYILTGNPMYPMLEEIFTTKTEFVSAMQSNANNHGVNLLKSKTVYEFFSQIGTNINWLLFNADLIFFLGFISLLMLSVLRIHKFHYPLLSGWIAYSLFTLLWGSDIARLFAVNYGMIVLLIALNIQWICGHPSIKPFIRNLFYWIIILSLFLTFVKEKYSYLSSPNIRWFGGIYLSEPARYDWLTEREIFPPELFQMRNWLRENLDAKESIYGYRTGYLFYLYRRNIVSDAHFKEQVDQWLENGFDFTHAQFQQLGVNYILYAPEAKGSSTNPHPRFEEFSAEHCEVAHQEGTLMLYKLKTF